MNLDQALDTYIAEAGELLGDMEDALLRLEAEPDNDELVNALFRAVHTIKGSAGIFGLDAIVSFTHVVEHLMDKVRRGEIAICGELIATLLPCRDHIATLVGHIPDMALDDATSDAGAALLSRLQNRLGSPAGAGEGGRKASSVAVPEVALQSSGGGAVATDTWHLSLRFGKDVLRNGMDPLSFIRYLGTLGQLVSITALPDAIPEAASMDQESCYLGFEIDLQSTASKETIEGVFEFVREDSLIHILPPRSRISEYVALINALPEETMRIGQILVASGALTTDELVDGLVAQDDETLPLGEILVEQQRIQPEIVAAAVAKQKQVNDRKASESKLVRVQAEKLDRLINLVGELVIAGAGANLLAQGRRDAELQEATGRITQLVEEIRDGALRLRMVQLGETFGRFQRVVRDVGKELGKEIDLVISGAETELDKTMVDKIADPLTHLVRNAMDHGIEPAASRIARGKPARGTLRLNAFHDSGSVVIEVADDGGGLDRDKILAKAIAQGIVPAHQTLSEHEIYPLIFEAGFSTADQVSNLSGRGVGMDVVRQNIEALRGTVELDSTPGQGTTVRIRLPLTLAIIDGFLVGVADSSYVVPLDMVLECIELSESDRRNLAGRAYLDLRGEALPFVRLRQHFELEGSASRRESIVVVRYGEHKAGLVVDQLIGEFQTVIKPLGKVFSRVKGISGSTILGSGAVALILDVPSLIQQAAALESDSIGGARSRIRSLAAM